MQVHATRVQAHVLSFIGLLLLLVADLPAQVDPEEAQGRAARALSISGSVTRTRAEGPWRMDSGEQVPVQQEIKTGPDGYGLFAVAGDSRFELFANSCIRFRQNAARAEDLLDLQSGRARVYLKTLGPGKARIFTPVAQITALEHATIALAVDEDNTTRIDVLSGSIAVQHTLLPRGDAVFVKAVDSLLVYQDAPLISRQMERGSLYRYIFQPLVQALTLGKHGDIRDKLPIIPPDPVVVAQWRRKHPIQ